MPDSSAARALLSRVWDDVGGESNRLGATGEPQHPVPLAARTDVGGLAWASVAAASMAASLVTASTGLDHFDAPPVQLDPSRIAVAYSSERHLAIDGQRPRGFAPLSGFFRTRDGWVRTHGNYPHHAAALRTTLRLPDDADASVVATAFADVVTADIANAVTANGGLCVPVLPEAPCLDAALASTPLIRLERLGDAPRSRPLVGDHGAPLRGIRVLDLTRVIAGPVGTRTLALLGADVLRIDPPQLPEISWQHLDTGHGKRSALLDLTRTVERAHFEQLLSSADVVALGYRRTALDRLGLSPAALAVRHPGIIVLRHSAWADSSERGFDSLVQARSGIALIESLDGVTPGALPAQALDHSTGYLLASAAIMLLRRRAREGGSWLADTSLRRMAAQLLSMPRVAEPETFALPRDVSAHLQQFTVDGHRLTTTAPAIHYEGSPEWFAPPRPWGCDEPSWIERS